MTHLLQPFPEPSQRILAALVDLAILARGGDAAEAIMATGEILPRPWDITSITDPDLRRDTWQWLDAFVIYLNTQHAWYSADHTPACWPDHPPLVRELGTLAFLRFQAGEANRADAVGGVAALRPSRLPRPHLRPTPGLRGEASTLAWTRRSHPLNV